MTQVLNFQVPAHPTGLEMRTQLNAIVLAILGDNAGPTEPPQTFPGMMWGDTTANRLRRRTNANDGWIDIGPLDDFLGDARTAANNANTNANNRVLRSGDSMTGNLVHQRVATDFSYSYSSVWQCGPDGGLRNAAIRYALNGSGGGALEFINSGGQNINASIGNDGNFSVRNSLQASHRVTLGAPIYGGSGPGLGEVELRSQDGTWCHMRGRVAAGGMEWINHEYTQVIAAMDNGGAFLLREAGQLLPNGNLYMQFRGWLSDALNDLFWWRDHLNDNKADRYAICHFATGLAEVGPLAAFGTIVGGDPWVAAAFRTSSVDYLRVGEQYLQFVQLRNN